MSVFDDPDRAHAHDAIELVHESGQNGEEIVYHLDTERMFAEWIAVDPQHVIMVTESR